MGAIDNLNLIPQEELHEQRKVYLVKQSTIFAIILLVIVGIVSAYYTSNLLTLKKTNENILKDIDNLRAEINKSSTIEISARNLDKKYTALNDVMNKRVYYSLLLEELRARKPEGIVIISMDVKGSSANISGSADNYVSIARYVNNLINKSFSSGNPKLQDLFTTVSLNSVDFDSSKNSVKYFIVVGFDPLKLKP